MRHPQPELDIVAGIAADIAAADTVVADIAVADRPVADTAGVAVEVAVLAYVMLWLPHILGTLMQNRQLVDRSFYKTYLQPLIHI